MADYDAHYRTAPVPIRNDLIEAHRAIAKHIAAPGTWWTGPERIAIAEESRASLSCSGCDARAAAVAPSAVSGAHDSLGRLPDAVVAVIHRVRRDSGRLSRSWFASVVPDVLDAEHYVELVGVVTILAGVDATCRALGVPAPPLPDPRAGEPRRRRPAGAKSGIAWVPMLGPEEAVGLEADLYARLVFVPNIIRALSLVPDQVRALRASGDAHYLKLEQLADPNAARSIDRLQMELVAARVSAMNECFY